MSTLYYNGSIPIASLSPNIETILFDPPNEEISFYEDVSPALAASILQNHNFANQRPVRSRQVKSLATAILADKFRPVSPVTFALNEKLKVVNVNGQHTLHAIINADKTTRLLINFTPEDARDVYTVIDNHQKRTVFDAVNAIGNWDGLSNKDLSALGSACKILANFNVRTLENDPYVLSKVMKKYMHSYALYKNSIIGQGGVGAMSKKLLGRTPMAVGLALFNHSGTGLHNTIREFFYRIVTGDCEHNSVVRSLHMKYMLGRRGSWLGTSQNEIKDILATWHMYNTTGKRLQNRKVLAIWQLDPNLWGTNVKFIDTHN